MRWVIDLRCESIRTTRIYLRNLIWPPRGDYASLRICLARLIFWIESPSTSGIWIIMDFSETKLCPVC